MSPEEQAEIVQNIMSGSAKNYCIKGATFKIKEDLKSWGWFWDNQNKYWHIQGVEENDPALKEFQGVDKTWIEEIK